MRLPDIARLAACLLLAVPALACALPRYTVTALAGAGSFAWDINESGQAVGEFGGNAWMSSDGLLTLLGSGSARGINDHGQVAGVTGDNGFLYSGGRMTLITGWGATSVRGINNAGTIVGMAEYEDEENGFERHAFSYRDGVMTDLGTLYGRHSQANAINNLGHIAGASDVGGPPNWPLTPFLYRDGTMTDLGPFVGPWSQALAINERDQVVGYFGTEPVGGDLYPTSAFLWDDGTLLDLGQVAGTPYSHATGINNLGQVVGLYGEGAGSRAFLYENGTLLDLNTLIDPASGWVLSDASAINDLQQIVGTACRAGACHAVRLDLVSAVPEPATWGMLLAGGTLLGWRRLPGRRRSRSSRTMAHFAGRASP
ncbi:MAG: PEP-CTERM sorting domain-containing protein [Telluria sp.]